LLVPGVDVSGGGRASVFEPVPGVLPPAVFDGSADEGRVELPVDPGSGDTLVPDLVASPPFVCANAAFENAKPLSNTAVRNRRYVMAILLEGS
jgi:hypothetical protein